MNATTPQHDPAKRIADVPRGTPPSARVRIELHIVRYTPDAWLVEQLDQPNGRAWLPRSVVGLPTDAPCGCGIFRIPLWLFRRVREQI
ncbi:MAG TPA: hypothetical protein VGR35_00225 [Tepidisphaeraceae bacterium]|nr:hypothetical protein [Tepidisphaeraceae bacterium]